MKKNMSTLDRVIRTLIAVVIIGLYLAHVISGTLAIVLLVIAAIFILTSIISFCPLYWLLGISTAPKPK
jgi:hypothetical protein